MTVKVTNGEIYAACTGDRGKPSPMEQLSALRMPVKVKYDLAKLRQSLKGPLGAIEDTRNGLVKEWGSKNERGQDIVSQFVIGPDGKPTGEPNPKWESFVKDFNELMMIERELNLTPVRLPEKYDGQQLATDLDLVTLLPFIEVVD